MDQLNIATVLLMPLRTLATPVDGYREGCSPHSLQSDL